MRYPEPEEMKPWQMRLTACTFFYFLLFLLFWVPEPIRDLLVNLGYVLIVLWLVLTVVLGNFVCDLIERDEKKHAKQEEAE